MQFIKLNLTFTIFATDGIFTKLAGSGSINGPSRRINNIYNPAGAM